jgi:hypothetical protein
MNIRGASALGCGLLLTLASCGSGKAVTTAAPAAAPAATTAAPSAPSAAATAQPAAPAASAAAVPKIYNFKTVKVGGGALDGAEFVGKPTAFWFWAPT